MDLFHKALEVAYAGCHLSVHGEHFSLRDHHQCSFLCCQSCLMQLFPPSRMAKRSKQARSLHMCTECCSNKQTKPPGIKRSPAISVGALVLFHCFGERGPSSAPHFGGVEIHSDFEPRILLLFPWPEAGPLGWTSSIAKFSTEAVT